MNNRVFNFPYVRLFRPRKIYGNISKKAQIDHTTPFTSRARKFALNN